MKSFALLSLAATAALAAPTISPEGVKVALPRRRNLAHRSTNVVEAATYVSELQHVLYKYGSDVTIIKGSTKSKRQSEEHLNDQGSDELYFGNIVTGSANPQTFTIDFDTGSADLFVPGPKCTTANGCTGTVRYNQDGTDEGNTTMVVYGSGTVSGENYFDNVAVAGLTATHQNIVSLTMASGFSGSDAEGLMGMAFQSIANSGQPPFFQTLISQGKVSNHEFSFYLGRESSGTGNNSELTLGGADSSKYTGTFTKIPLTAQTYWQVGVSTVNVNGQKAALVSGLDPTTGNAAIDTGTTIILAPTVAATSIYSRIPGSVPVPLAGGVGPTIFAYPCASMPNVSFVFAGATKQFMVNHKDFSLGELTSAFAEDIGSKKLTNLLSTSALDYCLGALAGFDIDPTDMLYVVGDSFLKNWYSTFSFDNNAGKPSVSFAKSVNP